MDTLTASTCPEILQDRINSLEARLERLERLQSRPGSLRAPSEAEAAMEAVSKAFSVPRERILARSRRMDETWARHAFCHLLHTLHGWHASETASPLGRHPNTGENSVHIATNLIETDPGFRGKYEAARRLLEGAE